MTADLTAETTAAPTPAALLDPPRPPIARLALVELRKMTDTRAGRWLLVLIALVDVAMMPVMLFAVPGEDQTLYDMVSAATTGTALLLPILGVLAVTSEWSQRTTLTTFTLVPGRHRIVVAKVAAAWVLATVFTAVSVVTAVLGRAVGELLGRSSGSWELPPEYVAKILLMAVISVTIGVAFGMVFMNTPLAIVLYFVLPIAWTTLGETVDKLRGAAGWLDTNRTMEALNQTSVSGEDWARLGVSLAVWLVLPLVAGVIRLTRREVK
ncbi:ABC transporter permease subunit [Actinomadura hibisca]|uniref:ABC transporter permease subunit n=1 Tax=Actinomadura hibisca TaxID=68565 RepID=UPI00082EFACC|nr:ABC transporter permease subunit [Actinomadura hibisca]